MTGAGISTGMELRGHCSYQPFRTTYFTAAGIPDFRTPGTGLYDNLQKYNLPHPTAVFEIGYFKVL